MIRPATRVRNSMVSSMQYVESDNTLSDAAPGETLRLIAWNIERGRGWKGAVDLALAHPVLLPTGLDDCVHRSAFERS